MTDLHLSTLTTLKIRSLGPQVTAAILIFLSSLSPLNVVILEALYCRLWLSSYELVYYFSEISEIIGSMPWLLLRWPPPVLLVELLISTWLHTSLPWPRSVCKSILRVSQFHNNKDHILTTLSGELHELTLWGLHKQDSEIYQTCLNSVGFKKNINTSQR